MLQKPLALLAIVSLTLTPLSPVNAAVKAGSACPKVGNTSISSGKTFTCIKSGKKLIWDKGVATSSAAPQTSAAVQAQLGARMANIAAACDEVQGTFALTITGRAFDARVSAGNKNFIESECVSCGACVQACPTGALKEKNLLTKQKLITIPKMIVVILLAT